MESTPSMFGTGIRFLGRLQPWARRATCGRCRAEGQLASYTATRYLVVAGAALFPLGPVRVEDECRACGQRSLTPWGAWLERRDGELDEACQALEDHPHDPTVAVRFLETMQRLHGHEDFEEEVEGLCSRFASDPKILAKVGDTYSFFREFARAEACFETCRRMGGECPDLQALLHLRRGRPEEAAALLEPAFAEKRPSWRWLLYLLVESYQSCKQSARAKEVLDRIASVWPEQAVEPEHKGYRSRSGKKRVPSMLLEPAHPVVPFFSQPLVQGTLLPLLLLYAWATWNAGRSRALYLVSGLDRPYDVEIKGSRHRLVPGMPELIRLPEGVVDFKSEVASGTVQVETFWLTRAVRNKVFVLNPDGLALLHTQQMRYSKREISENFDPQVRLSTGKTLYEFDDIDLVFEEFPATISIVEGEFDYFLNRPTYRRRLALRADSAAHCLVDVHRGLGRAAASEFLRRSLELSPSMELLETARSVLGPDVLVELARPHLDKQPVETWWHLLHQRATSVDDVAEYRQRLARSPQDAELQFLLAWVAEDEGLPGKASSPFATWALAQQSLARGDFGAAEKLCSQPLTPLMREVYVAALWGQKRYQDLLQLGSWELGGLRRALLLAEAERLDEARRLVEELALADPALRLELNYALGQPNPAQPDEDLQFMADLLAGQVEKVSARVDGYPSWPLHLQLHLVAAVQKQPELAGRELKQAVELLRTSGSGAERGAAECLEHAGPWQKALRLVLKPQDKRVFLGAMALRDPKHRRAYCELAARLNFERSFPYWTVREVEERSDAPKD